MKKVDYGKEFSHLGAILRDVRTSRHEKLVIVAESIGIDKTYLSKIENGHVKPSREILGKLVGYYEISDSMAAELYTRAGFNDTHFLIGKNKRKEEKEMENKSVPTIGDPNTLQVNVPNSEPVLYSDSVFVTTNDFGVVFDFAQILGSTNKHNVVARIGMSKDHAEALLKVLQDKLSKNMSERKKAIV